jgi:hypothetical protein
MSLFKHFTLAAVLTTLPLTAAAEGYGIGLDSLIIRDDIVTVDYSNKLRTCQVLINDDTGARVQKSPKTFCDVGVHNLQDMPLSRLHVQSGDWITMCAIADLNNCTDPVQVRLAGDLNGDNEINIIDLQLLHAAIMGESPGWWPAMPEDEAAADMNGDGAVNVIDILMLIEALWEAAE